MFPDSSESNGRAEGLWDREGVQVEARKQEDKTRSCRNDGSTVLVHPLLHGGVMPVDLCCRDGDLSAEMGLGMVLGGRKQRRVQHSWQEHCVGHTVTAVGLQKG